MISRLNAETMSDDDELLTNCPRVVETSAPRMERPTAPPSVVYRLSVSWSRGERGFIRTTVKRTIQRARRLLSIMPVEPMDSRRGPGEPGKLTLSDRFL